MSKKLNLKGSLGKLQSKTMFPEIIAHNISETNSSFEVK